MNVVAVWWFLIYMLLVGMAAGWFAWVVLGRSKALMTEGKPNWGLLLVLGIVGSFVAGTGASLLLGDGFALHPSGMIGSILGAIIVVAIYARVKK
jgi:uncharacterized membrane protein YeaQ/YmgE (transglycosylase-associated protein family)